MGRFLIGFGSAFAFVGVLKVASEWFPADRFGMIAGLTTSLGMIGAMFGDNVMAILVKEAGWQWTMYLSAIFGLLLTGIIWAYIRDVKPGHVEKALSTSDLSFKTLLLNVGELLKKPQMWHIAFIGGILYSSFSVFAELWGVPYFQQAKGVSHQVAAGLTSMVFIGWAVGGPIVGFLSDYLNNRRIPLILGSLLGAATIAVIVYVDGMSIVLVGFLLILFGVFSSAENIVFVIAKESTAPHLTGSAIAVTNMFVMLAGTILQPFVGYILDLFWDGSMINGVHHYSNQNFQYALLILPVTFVFAQLYRYCLRQAMQEKNKRLFWSRPTKLAIL